MNSKLKIAIIGCGRIAQRHAEHIHNIGTLIAVCDIIEERADALAGKYGAKSYYTIDTLLASDEEIQLVSICTPNGLHAEHTIMSLYAGCTL